jgi:photosystem II stability/assembly factor-like uncharacterized protein
MSTPRLLPPLRRLASALASLVLLIGLGFGLGGCVTTGLPLTTVSPWQPVPLDTRSNPLDLAFTDARHGFLVGSNRLIMETDDGGAHWQELLHTDDAGQSWSRLFLDTKLPGEPYLVTALGPQQAELATTVGAVYATRDAGTNWQALVSDAAGAVRDLRRADDGRYVSVSSLGNFFATWDPGQPAWQVHQRVSSQRLQSMGFQPDGALWMVTRGAQLRFNPDLADQEAWSKPIIPITNGYGYLDLAWDPAGGLWTGGGSGTLLVSSDGGKSWQKDPVGAEQPSNFTRILFSQDGKGFVLGERGSMLRWVG